MSLKKHYLIYGLLMIMSVEYAGIWANNIYITKIILLFFSALYLLLNMKAASLLRKAVSMALLVIAVLIAPKGLSVLSATISCIILLASFSRDFCNALSKTAVFLMSYIVLTFLWHSNYVFENILRTVSYSITKTQCKLFMKGTEIGPSLSLFIPFFSFLVHDVLLVLKEKSKKSLIRLVLLILIHSVYSNLLSYLMDVNPQIACNAVPWLGFWGLSVNQFDSLDLSNKCEISKGSSTNISLSVCLIVSIFMALFSFPVIQLLSRENSSKAQGEIRVAIVNSDQSLANFSAPPSYQPNLIGYGNCHFLYGMTPYYLQNEGYDVKVYGSIEGALEESDVVILAHYNIDVDHELNTAVADFVKNGGIIFAFVDHTNIFNSTDATNGLLSFSSIRANNDTCDSLFHFDGKLWSNALDVSWQYSTVHDKDINIGVWGGASVCSESIWNEALVIAKFGLSDPADLASGLAGGYMGNRKFDVGERFGDIPLAYRSAYGKGAVVLFGDTSYIQVPVLMYDWSFVSRVINDTMNLNPMDCVVTIVSTAILLLLFIISVIILFRNNNPYYFLTILAGIMIAVIASGVTQTIVDDRFDSTAPSESCYAYIDYSHKNSFSFSLTEETQITGIGYNLFKKEYPVYIGNSTAKMLNSKIYLIVNPEKPLTDTESETIIKKINDGDNVILIVGGRNHNNIAYLLEAFDIEITSFLGPIPWIHYGIPLSLEGNSPHFVNAWNIEYDKNRTDIASLYSYDDFCCAISVNYGKGKLFLISDDRFFEAKNLEGELSGDANNIELFQQIIDSCG